MSEKKGLVNYNDLDLDDQQNDIKLKKLVEAIKENPKINNDDSLKVVLEEI